MSEEIRVCENHSYKQIPLISTFAFMGAEYWCPYCGYTGGFFGAGEEVPLTSELKEELKVWKEKSEPFLRAMSRRTCSSFMWNGERITYAELPQEEKDKDSAIIKNWKYTDEY